MRYYLTQSPYEISVIWPPVFTHFQEKENLNVGSDETAF